MVDVRDPQLLEALDRPDDVEDRIRRTHLVQVHRVGGRAVHARLGLRQHLEGACGMVADPGCERGAPDPIQQRPHVMSVALPARGVRIVGARAGNHEVHLGRGHRGP